MATTAVLDACVLYPAPLRDVLLWLARAGLFRARWTEDIHREWIRNLVANRPDLDPARLHRTAGTMNEAIEDSLVTGHEPLVPGLSLPDADDRHVLAAAILCRADVIVTFNTRDFPAKVLQPLGVQAWHPDDFILRILETGNEALAAVRQCRANLRHPPVAPGDWVATLARQGLPGTAAFLSARVNLL